MASLLEDLTLVYYTCNEAPLAFRSKVYEQLLKAAQGLPIITVSHEPLPVEEPNIIVDLPRHHLSIYRQALIGAKAADTRYIALAEDDVLYSPEHFKHRPLNSNKFAYNLGYWNVYTWGEPVFSYKGRRNMHGLICDRQLFINAMEERFAKWPDDDKVNLGLWAEPGKYESQLGVSVQLTEEFYTNPPNIVFSHQTALSYNGLGERKRLGELRANSIPYWNDAVTIRKYYEQV